MKPLKRKCKQCGRTFLTYELRREFCNLGCEEVFHNSLNERAVGIEVECIICGGKFIKKREQHICCSPKCSYKLHHMRQASRRFAEIECEICGKKVKPLSYVQRYCPECAREHHLEICRARNRKLKKGNKI